MSGANIYIPQGFNFREIVKFVLSVLGLTWQNIRTKLVRAIGETAVRALETGFQLVVTLVTQGPAAAWEQIQQGITNLREMVMEQIMTFVRDRIVTAAITRLVTSLNPAGAFIQAVIAIYNTVMFFVERLRQITQVAMSFIDSMAAIASGNITAAANRVEQTMAGLLTLVISFLARLVGLGRVSDAVVNVVNRIRAPIDRALDRVVEWIVTQARRLGRFIAQAGVPQDPQERLRLGMQAAVTAVNRFRGNRVGVAVLRPVLAGISVRYGFRSLEPIVRGRNWAISGQVNPVLVELTSVEAGDIEVGALPDSPEFQARLAEFQRLYRQRLQQDFAGTFGRCFECAASLGWTAINRMGNDVAIYIIMITPRPPQTSLRPARGRTIEGAVRSERIEAGEVRNVPSQRNVVWPHHVVISVNGHIFDHEFDDQGHPVTEYIQAMFPNQNPRLARGDREQIWRASVSRQRRVPFEVMLNGRRFLG